MNKKPYIGDKERFRIFEEIGKRQGHNVSGIPINIKDLTYAGPDMPGLLMNGDDISHLVPDKEGDA